MPTGPRQILRAKFEGELAYLSPAGTRALNAVMRVADCIGLCRGSLRLRRVMRLFFGEKGFDFSWGGHGGLGAVTGDGDGGDGGGVFDAGDRIAAAEEGGGEGAVEGVAGGGGVDGFYAVGRHEGAFAGGERDVAAAFAEFEQHVAAALFQHLLRGVLEVLAVLQL